MSSTSLGRWTTDRAGALDEIEAAHRSVGGTGPGRRYATHYINQAYVVLLSSQFQAFCRELHSECADSLVRGITPTALQNACREAFVEGRKLDRGNPNRGNLGSDFSRFGLTFWDDVRGLDSRNWVRENRLEELNVWRNAIAHQDFDLARLRPASFGLATVRHWRSACNQLAHAFDEVMRRHIQSVTGTFPW